MDRYVVVHYHEVGLKGKNRAFFEEKLRANIGRALSGLEHDFVRRITGRIIVKLNSKSRVTEIRRRLSRVFGIVNFAVAYLSERDPDKLCENLWKLVCERRFASFKIDAKRADKSYPLNSMQINQHLGAYIKERSQARVDLERPDLTCHIEIVEKYAFIYFRKEPGPGGLPVSSGGRVVALLSGGIDSPVAAYKLMKRGCNVIFVHFHSFPHTTIDSQVKARRIVEHLNRYQYESKLYLVPFADVQRQIVAFAPPPVRVILYRRFMLRIAEEIARLHRAHALVTGDSLGQVASQTLENINVIGKVASLPVLRPLIGEDKEDIIRLARRIGTYDISILPDQDCCTLFIPKHPETRAEITEIEHVEARLPIDELVAEALRRASCEEFSFAPASVALKDKRIIGR